jgi:hypothetical protein
MAADDLLCMMIRKPDYEEELSGDDPLLPKQITPLIEVCGNQEKISAFD